MGNRLVELLALLQVADIAHGEETHRQPHQVAHEIGIAAQCQLPGNALGVALLPEHHHEMEHCQHSHQAEEHLGPLRIAPGKDLIEENPCEQRQRQCHECQQQGKDKRHPERFVGAAHITSDIGENAGWVA